MSDPLIPYVNLALRGNQDAVEHLVRQLQDGIYNLALRMLHHPQDAEDATQDIFIKIISHLGSFRSEGLFRAWAMKIASNHLISACRTRGSASLSFEEMASRIKPDWPEPWTELESEPMRRIIVEEFRIACLQVVLLGLDRPHRLAYILGEVFDVSGPEGGEILSIQPAAYRKRLQRARSRVRTFLLNHCALIRPENPCICERQADYYLATGRLDRNALVFATHPCRMRSHPDALDRIREMDALSRIVALFKTHPGFQAQGNLVDNIREVMDSGRFQILGGGLSP